MPLFLDIQDGKQQQQKRIATKTIGPKLFLSARPAIVSIMSPSSSPNS